MSGVLGVFILSILCCRGGVLNYVSINSRFSLPLNYNSSLHCLDVYLSHCCTNVYSVFIIILYYQQTSIINLCSFKSLNQRINESPNPSSIQCKWMNEWVIIWTLYTNYCYTIIIINVYMYVCVFKVEQPSWVCLPRLLR